MRGLAFRVLVAGSILSLGNACRAPGAYTCESDSQCVADGVGGICAPPGFCAFPSEDCPSGHRFGAHAGSWAHACVPEPDASSTASSTDSGTGQSHASSEGSGGSEWSTSDVDDTSPSSATGESESSTGGVACSPLWEDLLSEETNWTVSTGPETSLSFGAQGLIITPGGNTYGRARSKDPVPEDIELTVHLTQALEALDAAETLVMIEDAEATNRLVIWVGGSDVNMHTRVAGVGTLQPGPVYDPELHRFLRIRNVAGVVWFGTSADGEAYTELWSTEGLTAGTDPLHVILSAGVWEATAEPVGQARFASASACIPNGADG
jgi:hypothetical protein